jgi:hypothetical protein
VPQLTWGQLFGLLFMTMEPNRAISVFSRVGDDDSAPEVSALAWRSAAEPWWGFPVHTGLRRVLVVMSLVVATFFGTELLAQTVSGADADLARPIESVTVIITNPSPETGCGAPPRRARWPPPCRHSRPPAAAAWRRCLQRSTAAAHASR